MTEDDELDNRVGKFIVDVLVSHELSVPQAVQKVDAFMESVKGTLPEEKWLRMKANLLELVFFKGKVKEERKRAATHEKADDEDELVYQGPNCPPCPKYIVELAEQAHARMEARGQSCIVSVTEDVEVPLWEAIKAHLPEGMITPENVDGHAWRIGFLVGLCGETVVAKALRWLWKLP